MSRGRGDVLLDHIREVLAAGADGGPSDAQLLDAFARGEETAFALLVRRHGRLVWGVCRRVLGHRQDAEDAFQATFLVLAKKVATIRKRESVGAWLYGVAYRLSSQLRRRLATRRQYEGKANPSHPVPAPDEEISLREALAILDEEIGRLPERLRGPLVLCYLQGKTNDQAARELGCPPGTLRGRLLHARKRLSARLARRGVTLPAGALAVLLAAGSAEAVVPTVLTRSAAGGVVSAEAIGLAKGMVRAMTMSRVKMLLLGVLAVGLMAAGAGVAIRQAATGAPPGPDQEAKADQPKAKGDLHGDPLPDGALARLGTVRLRHGARVTSVAFTADGKEILTAGPDGVVRAWEAAGGRPLRRLGPGAVRPADGPAAPLRDPNDPIPGLDLMSTRPTALTPDGRTAALGDLSDVIHIWDLAAGKELCRVTPDAKCRPLDLILSPDGKTLLIAPPLGDFILWDVATGKMLRCLEGVGKPLGLPNAKAAGGGDGFESVGPPVFSPDGKSIAATYIAPADGAAFPVGVKVWDVATGKESRRLGKGTSDRSEITLALLRPAFSPDGKVLARVAPDETVRLHDLASGNEVRTMGKGGKDRRLTQLVFAPDGKRLAAGTTDGPLVVFDADSGKELRTVGDRVRVPSWDPSGLDLTLSPAAFSPDGKTLALGWGDNAVRLWDVETGKLREGAAGHAGAIAALGVVPGGKTAVTGSGDATLREWDLATGKELRRFRAPDGEAVALAPTGRTAAFVNGEGQLVFWDVAAEKAARTITPPRPEDAAGNVLDLPLSAYLWRFSPDGKLLAGQASPHAIHLWDVGTGKLLATLKNPDAMPADKERLVPDRTADLTFSRDGRTLVTVTHTGSDVEPATAPAGGGAAPAAPAAGAAPGGTGPRAIVCVWDLATKAAVRRWEVPGIVQAVAIAPGSRAVATGTETTVTLWEVATAKERFRRDGAGPLVAFSPDGRLLAAARGSDADLIDTGTGKPAARLTGHAADVTALAFTDDGRALLTGSADSTAVVWDAGRAAPPGKVSELSARHLDGLWNDLGDADAARAFAAAEALGSSPKQAVGLARERLKPAVAPDARRVKALVANLDSDNFEDRDRASRELANLGDLARPALTELLEGKPSLEARRRAEELLGRPGAGSAPPTDLLRGLRVVELLERAGTTEAKELLGELAKGAPGARLTVQARAALKRLGG